MFVKFHSDGSIPRKGFSASFKKEAIGPFPCGDVLAESGKIQSFNYPNDYPNNEDCIWKITVPSGYNVMLEFETPFDIENDGSCSYDYLEIRDGGAATSPFLGERLCGTTVPNTIKSTGNTMFVKFHSDGSIPRKGFSASFKKEAIGPFPCGDVLAESGKIQSFNYPNDYPNNEDCIWKITSFWIQCNARI